MKWMSEILVSMGFQHKFYGCHVFSLSAHITQHHTYEFIWEKNIFLWNRSKYVDMNDSDVCVFTIDGVGTEEQSEWGCSASGHS